MKTLLRQQFKDARRQISPNRRAEAEEAALQAIMHIAEPYQRVLSYVSFRNELCTKRINAFLGKKLLLPRLTEDRLDACIPGDLEKGPLGIMQPLYTAATAVPDLVLVPAVAFDARGHRLGYGKGCYDRFLCSLPSTVLCCGLGFTEQLAEGLLPAEPHDIALSRLLLV